MTGQEKPVTHKLIRILIAFVFAALTSTAMATTYYVDGLSGKDSNNCLSVITGCKTIGHAISLVASGDTITVAGAKYAENLIIRISLNLIGSGARITIIDGGGTRTVISIASGIHVSLSDLTIQNGKASLGAGIWNQGTLKIANSTIMHNTATSTKPWLGRGGGIYNSGSLRIDNSTISANSANHVGAGILSLGKLTINNSTITGNKSAYAVGGIAAGSLTMSSSTVARNSATTGGGGISVSTTHLSTIQNSIVANNPGGNCNGTLTSHGYNLSNDSSCNFNGAGDLNNIDPLLGWVGNNGGPTNTMPLLAGSPAVDAGNPNGCTDSSGHLLKTDQRGKPRPDPEDTGGCDIGSYERQRD